MLIGHFLKVMQINLDNFFFPLMHKMSRNNSWVFCIFIIQHLIIKKGKAFHLRESNTVMDKARSLTLNLSYTLLMACFVRSTY